MGSQFAPECLPIVNPGEIPLFKIDGLESYFVQGGHAFSRYFVIEPLLLHSPDLSKHRPLIRRVCLSLICSTATQTRMRRQVEEVLAGDRPAEEDWHVRN